MSDQDKIDGLTILLTLQHELQQLYDYRDFGFFVVNETYRLTPYQNAILWTKKPITGYRVIAASGVATVDDNAPFNIWMTMLVQYCQQQGDRTGIQLINKNELPDEIVSQWPDKIGYHLLWCPFIRDGFDPNAGMVFVNDSSWTSSACKQIEWLIAAYSYSWYFLSRKKDIKYWFNYRVKNKKKLLLTCALVVISILLFPVRQTITAPAEVVAKDPVIITAPFSGVVHAINIDPNQLVDKKQQLVAMDHTDLLNNTKLAQQQYQVALREYQRAIQKGFKNSDSRSKVSALRAVLDEKKIKLKYAKALLDKSIITAPISGVAIFDHKSHWLGKPVITGERIMQLSKPDQVEVSIDLPVSDAIQFKDGAQVKLYLSGSPLSALEGKLSYSSYEAHVTENNILAYHLLAQLNKRQLTPRIGLQGTAKIYGDYTILLYYLLRRPFSVIRQTLGW